jgi:cytochrome d ubiquinol oxidase subunit I
MMETLEAARIQMASSMVFHIIFACIGMIMPFFMVVSHYRYLKTNDPDYLSLTKAWQKGVAIFFVTGAVSGTILSFELGLLWPGFMEHAGPIIGMPFSLEGSAFFIEAIAIGFYLYGWKRIKKKWLHWTSGLIVGLSGLTSGILVVAANSWMNSPNGFDYENGVFSNIDPVAAMLNDAWFSQALHMMLAAIVAVGFGVAGMHAIQIIRKKRVKVHKKAFKIAIIFGAIGAILQPISGDISAKDVANRQPVKLAAMEAHFNTEAGAPLFIGGIVDEEDQSVQYKIEIPKALSFLAFGDFNATVQGLNDFPKEDWPPVAITHYSFQIMVGIGSFLMLLGIIYLIALRKQKWQEKKWFWWLFAAAAPLGFLAVEAGWIVTEVGRQPWIIHQVMRTEDAVTPIPGIEVSMYFFIGLYLFLSLVIFWLMKRQITVFNAEKSTP